MELVLIRLSASHAMMRKSSHQVGFLEAANRKLLFSSRRSGDRMYEDRISPLKANAWGVRGGQTGRELSNVAERHHLGN